MAKIRAMVLTLSALGVGLYLEGYRPAGSVPTPDAAPTAPIVMRVVEPVPPDPPAPVETPYRLVLAALDREAFPDVQQHGSTVRVHYRLDSSMTTTAAGRRAFDRNAVQIVPDLFARFPTIGTVEMEADAPTTDIRGNKGRGLTANITFSRQNARTIRWGAIDSVNVERLADTAWYDARFQ